MTETVTEAEIQRIWNQATTQHAVGHMISGSRFMRALEWETTERRQWAGRDWRRVKRERRRFMRSTAPS